MQIGFVGLGKMGENMVTRLLRGGHDVVGFDVNAAAVTRVTHQGARGAESLDALVATLSVPRAVWIMVPAGAPTDTVITSLATRMSAGDVLIDGGNTYFKDDVRRAGELASRGIHYI